MIKKLIFLCVVALMSMTQSFGGVTLTIPDVSITPGATSYVVINFDLGSQAYTAYQFDIAYPEGISSVEDNEGNPAFTKGDVYSSTHSVSSGYAPDGKARFQCFANNSAAFTAQSGTLLMLTIKAAKSLAEGTYQATISPIEFSQTDATPDRPDAVTFNIQVTNTIILDEESTLPPVEATGANVKVKRTIKANEWSTLCLPFNMTEAQVKEFFGDDVQLAYFDGYEVKKEGTNVTGINIKFVDGDVSDGFYCNYPYLIKTSKDITEFTLTTDITPDVVEESISIGSGPSKRTGKFIGTYQANTIVPENSIFLSGNKFWYSSGKTKMKAFRAYFTLDHVLTNKENADARITMSFNDDTTGVKNVEHKVSDEDIYYNLNGQRVEKPIKGFYVKDGMKIIVK